MNLTVEKRIELEQMQADELILALYKDEPLHEDLARLNETFGGSLAAVIEQEKAGEANNVTVIHTLGKLKVNKVVLLGLGEKGKLTFTKARDAFAKAVKTVRAKGKDKQVALVLPEAAGIETDRMAQAAAEAFLLGTYSYEGYRQKPKQEKAIAALRIYPFAAETEAAAAAGVKKGEALATGTNLARDLTNTPSNYLTPRALKDAIVEVAERYGMPYEVLEKDKLAELGMGGVLSVAQGSAEPPYVVVVKYQGRETWDNVIGLIGKGVTFDTGGISIKPVAGMEEMKSDMGGSATLLGAVEAIGRLKPKANVMLVVGCVENMPSGTAFKPGDVITTMSGKTVEIITTDAEGRLVLADCITYAKMQGVSCLIDCATLTGGVVVALGAVSTGAMSNDQSLVNELLAGAEQAGERLWQLPTFEEYRQLNKSRVADLKNSGGRQGHAIIAGVFLQEFVEETPWVHLDIAGTAYINAASDYHPGGATGAMARSVAQFILSRSEK
ncbi:leucyl aminopeptidase [Brevibacillus fulvus]|uniref:Probable cytosol aminopeptidase n=1 Tax=Brevibacillus fulvus TaxID=1125967 RepID=A0A938Y5M1_9BACL|nr:leucyl aminopeptidase [Brevibacillus fulvus]MBM7592002.1 leucyl aminopeptidase [Brevibacillus fulvus]